MSSSAAAGRTFVPESAEGLGAIAHELRQPLSNIESIAYYLSLVLPREETRVQEQLVRLQQLVEQSNWILTCGLQLLGSKPALPQSIDLDEIVSQGIADARGVGRPLVQMDLACDLRLVRADPSLGRMLVQNLLILFAQCASASHPVRVQTSDTQDGGAMLEFSCSTPAFANEEALGAGSGLALASARRIMAAHGGRLECEVGPAKGIRVCALFA